MRVVLVFTPPANPTYAPLGMATLDGYLRRHVADCRLETIDLNIAAWHRMAECDERGLAMRRFMRGDEGDFFDRGRYANHQQAWSGIADVQEQYLGEARGYLEHDAMEGEFEEVMRLFADRVLQSDPELIGFSVMYPQQVLMTLALAKYIRSHHGTEAGRPVIVVGGAAMSAIDVREILAACPFVDAVFSGEGEAGLRMLCEHRPFAEIAGLAFRANGGIVVNGKPETMRLSEIPLPTFAGADLAAYFNPRPVFPIVFSRGCMWRRCRFCSHNFSYSGYRRRNTAQFVEHLARMAEEKGVRHFYFADQYMDAEDMAVVAQEILRRGLKIAFQIMVRPTASYTAEVCRTLYAAGCRWISWGVESGSQRLLDVCGKGTDVGTIQRVLGDAHAAGIVNLLMMIFGMPTSGPGDLRATFDLLDNLGEAVDDVTSSSFQLWEGTAFAANASAYGLKITGREKLFEAHGRAVHSLRLYYQEKSQDGTFRDGAGAMEIAQWRRRGRMAGWCGDVHGLCCEHYLLYAANRRQ